MEKIFECPLYPVQHLFEDAYWLGRSAQLSEINFSSTINNYINDSLKTVDKNRVRAVS